MPDGGKGGELQAELEGVVAEVDAAEAALERARSEAQPKAIEAAVAVLMRAQRLAGEFLLAAGKTRRPPPAAKRWRELARLDDDEFGARVKWWQRHAVAMLAARRPKAPYRPAERVIHPVTVVSEWRRDETGVLTRTLEGVVPETAEVD